MTHRASTIAAMGLAATLLAGCTGEGQATNPDQSEEPDTSEAAESDGPAGTIELAGVQQSHASGTTVAVTAVTVDAAGHIVVDLEARVAGRRDARLASVETVLVDDLGNAYEFVPPRANANASVARDHEAQASFAFVGPIDPDATRVTLGINANWDGTIRGVADEPANTITPTFAFEGLPLPGVGLDDEAAAPDDETGIVLPEAQTDVTGVVHDGPAGVEIEVTSIKVEPLLVTVTVEARNGGDRDKNLIQAPPRLRAELDGESLGNRYPFEFVELTTEDGTFERLTLGPGEEATAEFAFRGVVPHEATGLRLGFQVLDFEIDQGAPVSEERDAGNPAVVFTNLPLPEDAADVSGEDSPTGEGDEGEDR